MDAVAGYVALLRENGSRFTDARKVSAALLRAFVLAGLNGGAWLVGGVVHRVVKQVSTAPWRLDTDAVDSRGQTLGVTDAMIALARKDALSCSREGSLHCRMLGLSAITAYMVGARVGELVSTETPLLEWSSSAEAPVKTGILRDKHSLRGRNLAFPDRGTAVLQLHSSKTSGQNGRRPPCHVFKDEGDAHILSESGLASLLAVELSRWVADARVGPDHLLFSRPSLRGRSSAGFDRQGFFDVCERSR